jgi:hypothetical protein
VGFDTLIFLILLHYYHEGESGDCDITKHPFLYRAESNAHKLTKRRTTFAIYSEKDRESAEQKP